jgi:acyl carrier protein
MKSLDEIFIDVCEVIESSTGINKNEIKLESTLFDELGVDSIDLVDILFELETLFDLELNISDIELKAKEELGDIPYEIDGVITEEGLKALRIHMTEIDSEKLEYGITIHQLIQLFSTHSLCKLVHYKMEMKENETPS